MAKNGNCTFASSQVEDAQTEEHHHGCHASSSPHFHSVLDDAHRLLDAFCNQNSEEVLRTRVTCLDPGTRFLCLRVAPVSQTRGYLARSRKHYWEQHDIAWGIDIVAAPVVLRANARYIPIYSVSPTIRTLVGSTR